MLNTEAAACFEIPGKTTYEITQGVDVCVCVCQCKHKTVDDGRLWDYVHKIKEN